MKKSIQQFFHRLKGNKQMIIGLSLLTILIILAVFGEQLAPYDPKYLNDDLLAAPSSTYLLGTDNLGRDVLSMILYGIRTSLIIGFIAAMISAVIGVLVGGIAGYFGGILDKILNEIMNIFMGNLN